MTTHSSIPKARRIIEFLITEECSNENIIRLLNYQFEDTFRVRNINDRKGFPTHCIFELVSDRGTAIPIVKTEYNVLNSIRLNGGRVG